MYIIQYTYIGGQKKRQITELISLNYVLWILSFASTKHAKQDKITRGSANITCIKRFGT